MRKTEKSVGEKFGELDCMHVTQMELTGVRRGGRETSSANTALHCYLATRICCYRRCALCHSMALGTAGVLLDCRGCFKAVSEV